MGIRTATLLLCSLLAVRTGQGWNMTAGPGTGNNSMSCGGYQDIYGMDEFTSPNYPGPYPNYASCTWVLRANGRRPVNLTFTDFRLESDGPCRYDSVSIYDGDSSSAPLLARVCGRQGGSFLSRGEYMTVVFRSDSSTTYTGFRAEVTPGSETLGSCRYYCGYDLGNCSCTNYCRYYGNCCYDYQDYCESTTEAPQQTTAVGSCRYNCGYYAGGCSCSSSCGLYGNCCPDYQDYCGSTTVDVQQTSPSGSCRYNCGYYTGGCSCTSYCWYYGDCCSDYYDYCGSTTVNPQYTTAAHPSCGGNLHGSGSFSSPYYPYYYHDNAYCVWQISVPSGQRVFLTITDVQMENCCSCDYIEVYDGPSLNSRSLGKVCSNVSNDAFHSSSKYLTVLFRTDSSVVGRGFHADYTASLPTSSGRVDCSSDNMNIVIQTSYLNSMGYSGHDLYLNDQYCRPQVSSYQVVFSFALNTCGTRREFNGGRVVYTNGVRAYSSRSGEITRQSPFKLHVLCRMEPDTTAQIMYVASEIPVGNITGSGRFNASMAFYTSSSFYYPVHESPYLVTLNQYLYVQVKLRRSDSSLVLFLDTCVASPSPHDFSTRSYDLVRNGCRRDSTYYTYANGNRSVAQFRFQAFQFLRTHNEVYLQCKVAICQAYDYNSRCYQGCHSRKARDLRSSSKPETDTVVLGPIQLKTSEKPEDQSPEKEVIQAEV